MCCHDFPASKEASKPRYCSETTSALLVPATDWNASSRTSVRLQSCPALCVAYKPIFVVTNRVVSSRRCSLRLPADAKLSSFACHVAPLSAEYAKLRSAIAQTWPPSAESSTDCAALRSNG